MLSKGDRVKGYAKVVQREVEGTVYYIFSNGIGVLTPGGIVLMDSDEYELCSEEVVGDGIVCMDA